MKQPPHHLSLPVFIRSLALAWLCLPVATWAQEPNDVSSERARIVAERTRVEAAFRAEEKACYGKFAVNDCVKAAKARRRVVIADLRRQEVTLNDAERRRRAAEHLRELEERAAKAPPQAKTPPAAKVPATPQQPRSNSYAESASKETSRQSSSAAKQEGERERRAKKDADQTARANAAAENRRKYAERIAEAEERRAKLDKRLADRKKPAAKPLPTLPVEP